MIDGQVGVTFSLDPAVWAASPLAAGRHAGSQTPPPSNRGARNDH